MDNVDQERRALQEKIKTLTKEVQDKQDQREANVQKIAQLEEHLKSVLTRMERYDQEQNSFKQRTEEIKEEMRELNKKHFVVVENLIKELDALKHKVQEDKKRHADNKQRLLNFQTQFKKQLGTISASFDLKGEDQVQARLRGPQNSECPSA